MAATSRIPTRLCNKIRASQEICCKAAAGPPLGYTGAVLGCEGQGWGNSDSPGAIPKIEGRRGKMSAAAAASKKRALTRYWVAPPRDACQGKSGDYCGLTYSSATQPWFDAHDSTCMSPCTLWRGDKFHSLPNQAHNYYSSEQSQSVRVMYNATTDSL